MSKMDENQKVQKQDTDQEKELNFDDLGQVSGGGMSQVHVKKTEPITPKMKERS